MGPDDEFLEVDKVVALSPDVWEIKLRYGSNGMQKIVVMKCIDKEKQVYELSCEMEKNADPGDQNFIGKFVMVDAYIDIRLYDENEIIANRQFATDFELNGIKAPSLVYTNILSLYFDKGDITMC